MAFDPKKNLSDALKKTVQEGLEKEAKNMFKSEREDGEHINTARDFGNTTVNVAMEGAKQAGTAAGGIVGGLSGKLFGGKMKDDDTFVDQTAEEAEAKRRQNEEDNARMQEQRARVEAQTQEKLAELDEKQKEEEDKVKSGPHAPVSWFTSGFLLVITAIIDSILGLVPAGGDGFGFLFNVIVWSIPALLTFDVGAMGKIWLFYILDVVIGLVPEVVGTFTLGLGLLFNPLVDLIPEAGALLMRGGPPKIIKNGYASRIPALVDHVRKVYDKRRADVRKNGRETVHHLFRRLHGHFTGLAADNQKIMSLLLFALIAVLGPFMTGLLNYTNPVPILIAVGLFFVCDRVGLINNKEFFGLIMFMVLNIVADLLLFSSTFDFFGNNAAVGKVLFIVFGLAYVAKTMGWISSKFISGLVIISILAISLPSTIGYLGSDRVNADIDRGVVDTQAKVENFNLLEQLTNAIIRGEQKGSGEFIDNAEQEVTTEFIGVRLEDATPRWESLSQTKRQFIDITYSANMPFDIDIATTCSVGEIPASVERSPLTIRSGVKQERCFFDALPLGYHSAEVRALYNYRSTVRIPLKFMDESQLEVLGAQGIDPEEYVGGSENPLTDSGPIAMGVSNARQDGISVLKMPIVVERSSPRAVDGQLLAQLAIQFQSIDEGTGKGAVQAVNSARFKVPKGLIIEGCYFDGTPALLIKSIDNNNWYYETTDVANDFDDLDKLVCDVYIDVNENNGAYIDEIVPEDDWKQNTIEFTLDYYYQLQYFTEAFEITE